MSNGQEIEKVDRDTGSAAMVTLESAVGSLAKCLKRDPAEVRSRLLAGYRLRTNGYFYQVPRPHGIRLVVTHTPA